MEKEEEKLKQQARQSKLSTGPVCLLVEAACGRCICEVGED